MQKNKISTESKIDFNEIRMDYYFGNRINLKGETKPDLSVRGSYTLNKVLSKIYNPDIDLKNKIDEIQRAQKIDRNALKINLPKISPIVRINKWLKTENVISFTGIMALDFDKIEPKQAEFLRDELFKDFNSVIAAWLSSSGNGFRAFVRIPIISLENGFNAAKYEFNTYFWAFMDQLDKTKYTGFDESLKSPLKMMFLSYDGNMRLRKTATIFKDRAYLEPMKADTINLKRISNGSHEYILSKEVKNELKTPLNIYRINKIIEALMDESKVQNNGHFTVLKASYQLGGFVGFGYLSEFEAVDIMHKLIDKSAYLSKDFGGYKNSSIDGIIAGESSPIELKAMNY